MHICTSCTYVHTHTRTHTRTRTHTHTHAHTHTHTHTGELFDHGLDSCSTALLPLTVISMFDRSPLWGGRPHDVLIPVLACCAGFFLSHWEKYITKELYLPWVYDIMQLVGHFPCKLCGVTFLESPNAVFMLQCSLVISCVLFILFIFVIAPLPSSPAHLGCCIGLPGHLCVWC